MAPSCRSAVVSDYTATVGLFLLALAVLTVQIPVQHPGALYPAALPFTAVTVLAAAAVLRGRLRLPGVLFGALLVAWAAWLAGPTPAPLRALMPAPQRLASTVGGATAAQLRALLDESGRSPAPLILEGVVLESRRSSAGGLRLLVAVDGLCSDSGHDPCQQPMRGRLTLTLRYVRQRWLEGDRIAFRSRLRSIDNFGNPGEFDWKGWNARRGVYVSAFVWSDDDLTRRPASMSLLSRARRAVAGRARTLTDGRDAGRNGELLAALLTGDRSGLTSASRTALRDSGLAHVVAISGLHIGLVVGAVFATVLFLLSRRSAWAAAYDLHRPAAATALVAAIAYGVLGGLALATQRALVMAAVGLGSMWTLRRVSAWQGLALAALLAGLVMPGAALEAGFHLSFAAATALVAYAGRRFEQPPDRSSGRRRLLELSQVSLLCWLVTLPILAQDFGRISIVAPLANVLASVPVALAVGAGLLGAVALAVSPAIADLLLSVGRYGCGAVMAVAEATAALPGAAHWAPTPGWPLAVALSGLPVVALWGRVGRPVFLSVAIAAALLTGGKVVQRFAPQDVTVRFVSVGQGDAALVLAPDGSVIVVDTGPPGRGRMVLGPLLRRLWIGRVDYLVLTHLQDDHWGALAELVDEFGVTHVVVPGGDCDARRLKTLDELTGPAVDKSGSYTDGNASDARDESPGEQPQAGPHRRHAGANDRVRPQLLSCTDQPNCGLPREMAGMRVDVLWPQAADGNCDDNDRSIVLRLSYGGRRVLLTGDIEAAAEERLLHRHAGTGALEADVLKIAHHGSRTSSTAGFVAAVAPKLAVASVGRNNRYGFPAGAVVERLRGLGTTVLRTDTAGAVLVRLAADGELELRTGRAEFSPPAGLWAGFLATARR